MKEGLTVTGLTTAACLWVVAGVGIAVGGGYYAAALFTSALVFMTLGALSRIDEWVMHEHNLFITIHTLDSPGQIVNISDCLEDLHLKVRGIKVKAAEDEAVDMGGGTPVYIELEVYNRQNVKSIIVVDSLKKLDGVISVDVS